MIDYIGREFESKLPNTIKKADVWAALSLGVIPGYKGHANCCSLRFIHPDVECNPYITKSGIYLIVPITTDHDKYIYVEE